MQRVITPQLTMRQLDYIAQRVAEYLEKKIKPEESPMDIKQCALYLNMKESAVLKQAQRGYIPGHKSHGRWRFFQSEINEAIKNDTSAED